MRPPEPFSLALFRHFDRHEAGDPAWLAKGCEVSVVTGILIHEGQGGSSRLAKHSLVRLSKVSVRKDRESLEWVTGGGLSGSNQV